MTKPNEPDQEPKNRNWLYTLSPSVIATVLAAGWGLWGYFSISLNDRSSTLAVYLVVILLIFSAFTLSLDLIVKAVFNLNTSLVWIVEAIVLAIVLYYITR